jgi:adenine specific DNA methylase Mod
LVYTSYDNDYLKSAYKNQDKKGFYKNDDLTGPKINPNDLEWKGFHPSKSGRSWSINKQAVINLVGEEEAKKKNCVEKLDLLNENGLINFTKNGTPQFKRYLEASKGVLVGNLWNDIYRLSAQSKERIGYPTQKPQKLLERIIQMASNEGDVVLDPFVGGGTTVAVADILGRQWIGIDQSVAAVKVTEMRMQNVQGIFSKPFVLQLHKYDYDTLRYKDAFEFETFIVQQYGGISNAKQRGDLGLDGKTRDNTPIQVKRSDQIGRNVVDNFKAACERNDKNIYEKNKTDGKPVGFIIAFSFGKGAVQEVARLQNEENVIIQLVEVETIVPIAKKPSILVQITDKGNDSKNLRNIEFAATASSAAGTVEFFAWDFEYKDGKFNPQILIDKTGLQSYKFRAGTHNIAVKVIDSEGLENIEIIKLKVNGKIERNA